MTDDAFESTDSVRSGAPLKHVQFVTLDEPLTLEQAMSCRRSRWPTRPTDD